MILTKKDIRRLEENIHCWITPLQEAMILERFGTEAEDCHEWSEQDINEQIRKILREN